MNEHFTVGTGSTRLYEPHCTTFKQTFTIPAHLLLPPMSAPVQKVKTPVRGRKQAKRGRVERTRNGGTWTEAKYWGMMRSGLRRMFRYWKPAQDALRAAKFPWPGPRGRKHGYRCAACAGKFKRDDVQVDHVVPCGRLKCLEDLPGFVARMTVEGGFQILCRKCHTKKTQLDNEARNGT
jgi:5-methylcytosine-specific restriction endonuclease McrA